MKFVLFDSTGVRPEPWGRGLDEAVSLVKRFRSPRIDQNRTYFFTVLDSLFASDRRAWRHGGAWF